MNTSPRSSSAARRRSPSRSAPTWVRRRLERDFYTEPSDPPLPSLTVVGESAEEYRRDEEFHLARGIAPAGDWLQAVPQRPSLSALTLLLTRGRDGQAPEAAVVITEAPCDPLLATLLAAHFPSLPIYAYSPTPTAVRNCCRSWAGCTVPASMDLPPGHSLDVWGGPPWITPLTPPSSEGRQRRRNRGLNSTVLPRINRRQVRNALWMVDQICRAHLGHLRFAPGRSRSPQRPTDSARATFSQLGIDGSPLWRWPGRNYGLVPLLPSPAGATVPTRRRPEAHDGLVSWESVEADPAALNRAPSSLAATCEHCAVGISLPSRSGNSSVAPAPSRPNSTAAGRGLGHRCPASRCAPRR